jgi:cytochrome c oxidase subunit III
LTAHGLRPLRPAEQFDDVLQQTRAATIGMWVFLASEVLFFGALMFGYTVSRLEYPAAFAAASRRTDVVLGSINTAVLLTSSFGMALAVDACRRGQRRRGALCLVVTAALGALFLGIKGTEYVHDFQQHLLPGPSFRFPAAAADAGIADGAQLFFYLYFVMTGLHAVHLTIGIAAVLLVAAGLGLSRPAVNVNTVETTGLYWHLVDIVWIFLYPLLYLVSRAT